MEEKEQQPNKYIKLPDHIQGIVLETARESLDEVIKQAEGFTIPEQNEMLRTAYLELFKSQEARIWFSEQKVKNLTETIHRKASLNQKN